MLILAGMWHEIGISESSTTDTLFCIALNICKAYALVILLNGYAIVNKGCFESFLYQVAFISTVAQCSHADDGSFQKKTKSTKHIMLLIIPFSCLLRLDIALFLLTTLTSDLSTSAIFFYRWDSTQGPTHGILALNN